MFSGQKSASATTSFSSLSPSLRHSRVHCSLFGKYLQGLLRVHGTCKEQSAPGPPSWEPEAPWPQLCCLPPTRTPGRHHSHPHLVVVEAGLGGTAQLDPPPLTTRRFGFSTKKEEATTATMAPAPLPTSSEPRAFFFLAHPHRLRPRSLQLGAPSCPAATLPPLRVCYVPEHRSTCFPPPPALSGGAPTLQSGAGAVRRPSEEGVGAGQRHSHCCLTAPRRLPGCPALCAGPQVRSPVQVPKLSSPLVPQAHP